MRLEVGSNFWEYNLSDSNHIDNFNNFDYMKEKILLNTGRSAIKLCASKINKKSKNVLLPAYTCDTVINPFLAEGFNVHYYDLNLDLSININNLWEKTRLLNPDAVLFHGYFGFKTLEGIDDYITYAKSNGIIVIEDITQSLFSNIRRIDSDYIVASLRKWFAIPDGGILLSNNKITVNELEEDIENLELSISAFTAKKIYMEYRLPALKDIYLDLYRKANEKLNYDNIFKMSSISNNIFKNYDLNKLKIRRQRNFKFLYEKLKYIDGIKIIFDECKADNVPLYFPIYIENCYKRKEFQTYLAKNNIYCPIIWPKPKEFIENSYTSNYIYNHIICIPCDQRYNMNDMNRVIESIKTYLASN